MCNNGFDEHGVSNDLPTWCRDFKLTFIPWIFLVSTCFLILTLLVYFAENSLRKDKLMGRITIGFLTNLTLAFIIRLSDDWQTRKPCEEDIEGTLECAVKGYFKQYFFLAFFLWINAMSFNIWYKFTRSFGVKFGSDWKTFMRYFSYAQVIPLIICLFTLLVDQLGKNMEFENKETRNFLPNMGEYSCFLGRDRFMNENSDSSETENAFNTIEAFANETFEDEVLKYSVFVPSQKSKTPSYFQHPVFIYFQSFLMLTMMANLYFFIATLKKVVDGFSGQKANLKSQGKDDKKTIWETNKKQFLTISRLLILMGVWWIFELVTTAIDVEYGTNGPSDTTLCYLNLALDMPNLLTGLLIFLFTVTKTPQYMSLKEKASGILFSTTDTSLSN